MYQYSPFFMTELNKRMVIPTEPSTTSQFFGNYDFSAPQPVPSTVQFSKDYEKYKYISDFWRNIAPLGMMEDYVSKIDRGMIHKPNMSPDQYIMPFSQGLKQYDPERTQYSSPRTDAEREKIKTYNQFRNDIRSLQQPPPTRKEDEEHQMWLRHKDNA